MLKPTIQPLTDPDQLAVYTQQILADDCYRVDSYSLKPKIDFNNHDYTSHHFYANPKRGNYYYFVISPKYKDRAEYQAHYQKRNQLIQDKVEFTPETIYKGQTVYRLKANTDKLPVNTLEDSILIIYNPQDLLQNDQLFPILVAAGIEESTSLVHYYQIESESNHKHLPGQVFVRPNEFQQISSNLPHHLSRGFVNGWNIKRVPDQPVDNEHPFEQELNECFLIHRANHYLYNLNTLYLTDNPLLSAWMNSLIRSGQIQNLEDYNNPDKNPLYYYDNSIEISTLNNNQPELEIKDLKVSRPNFQPEPIQHFTQNFETLLKQTDTLATSNIPLFIDHGHAYNINDHDIRQFFWKETTICLFIVKTTPI